MVPVHVNLDAYNMNISLPSKCKITQDVTEKNLSKVEIFPLHPGYGHTIGNALRRVLLSSLGGAGITAVKIEGGDHEFMSLPHIKEEVLEIILNLKELNVVLHGDDKETLELEVSGAHTVTAKDFKKNASVDIANTDQHIATLTDKSAQLTMSVTIEKGTGFSPVEEREKEAEVGVIAIDTRFSPIKSVGYSVVDTRVGKHTDYDKIIFNIETDGTIEVKDALNQSARVLVEQFGCIVEKTVSASKNKKKKKEKEEIEEE
jgi:DNA-directed RNA polymerase subunit alpha